MLKKKTSSINFKTLVYLIIFSSTILLFLMLSQNILIKYSYGHYQEKKMKQVANNISTTKEDLVSKLEYIAYDNSVCIQYINKNEVISYNTLMVGCGLNKNNKQINNIINETILSSKKVRYMKLEDEENDTKAILTGIKVDNGYVFVYSPLEDLNTTNTILKTQFIYLTLIVIVIACLISYFLSNKITKPITNITKKAKQIGEGKYDIKFERSDVTEIDELALALEMMGKDLSKIDELRRDLMANVSHDLKTPLTMIRAYAEKVRDISYKEKEKMEDDLNVIIEETERLNILVNDILDLSKMQADAANLELEKFDLVKLINEVMKRYDILKSTEDYHFLLELPESLYIKADKKKITQVIYNLINNAINYTGKDKTVYIKLLENKKEYIFEVTDTGSGIKKEEIDYIWDKYYKNDKKHQRNVVSTGLGLSIVKEILEHHNFEYGVKSTLKKGSTFYFKIKKSVK